MRVVVAADQVGALSSLEAGTALATGWPAAEVHVLPVGVAGAGFVRSVGDRLQAPVETEAADRAVVTRVHADGVAALLVEGPAAGEGLPLHTSSAPLGAALADVLADLLTGPPPRRVHLDLAGLAVHDGGAGLLGALGALADVPLDRGVAGLQGLGHLDLGPARARLGDVELVGVVPAAELGQPLLGLRGITSLHGRAAGLDAEVLLDTDAALERLAQLAAPGVGAAPGPGPAAGWVWRCSRWAAG